MSKAASGTLLELGALFIFASALLAIDLNEGTEDPISNTTPILSPKFDEVTEPQASVLALEQANSLEDDSKNGTVSMLHPSTVVSSVPSGSGFKIHYPPYANVDRRGQDAYLDRIKDVPIETLQRICELACISMPQTYHALLLTSRFISDIAVDRCLPLIPVFIKTTADMVSFGSLVRAKPKTAARVRHLWIMPDTSRLRSARDKQSGELIRACPGLIDLACRGPVLLNAILKTEDYIHTVCTRLTVLDPMLCERPLAATLHGHRFFGQLTHLRWPGPPQDSPLFPLRLSNLTHLCLSPSHEWLRVVTPQQLTIVPELIPLLKKQSMFPVLMSVTIAHCVPPRSRNAVLNPWDMRAVTEQDERISFIPCKRTWKESQAWRAEVLGRRKTALWTVIVRHDA